MTSPADRPTPGAAGQVDAGRTFAELATPAYVLDRDVLVDNLATWQADVERHGVALRPHAKTHKCVEVARLQLEHGAVGLTVAKPSEGLGLLPSGVAEVLVAYPVVGDVRVGQLLQLAEQVRVTSTIDDLAAAAALGAAAEQVGTVAEVLVDVDVGLRRTGLAPEQAVELGVAAAGLPGVEVVGVFAYGGYPANDPDVEVRRAWAHQEASMAVAVARELRDRGIGARTVSVGGTPTSLFAAEVDGVTEVRPGIYALGDANSVRLGVLPLEACALRVVATVVSRPTTGRVVLDAGTKTLAADPGLDGSFGLLPGHPGARLARAWEEHGVLDLHPAAGPSSEDGGDDLRVGDRVEVVPNHICPAVNLATHLWVQAGERIVDRWPVTAR